MSKVTIDTIIEKAKQYNPSSDSDMLRKAYELAKVSHEGQKRDSGEDYIIHPLAVANILADLQLDDLSIITGLIHDVVEDTDVTLEEVTKLFGKEVANLVDGLTKLSKIKYQTRQERQAENLRKMFLAMAQDIRIVLIKLSDRLHNMRTLDSHHSTIRQKEIAQETVDIFAPLAHRLGIYKIKWELEDLSLKYLEPDKYKSLVKQIDMKRQEREEYLLELGALLKEKLLEVGIKADVSGRPKNFYSIYNKMIKQKKGLNEIYDINAMRVIVDNVKDCYGALGVIHTMWRPIPGRFKDYIAMPKDNMYQSIHTTMFGSNGEPFEVQIRTWEMHRISEYGIAAHWRYKEGKSADKDFDKKLAWLRNMLDWQKELRDDKEFMESVKIDLFVDSVFVFTPQGAVFEFPLGATPIDFAYRVHTQVGHQCVGAKVNQKMVALDYSLKNGDIVEVLTARGSGPSRDWLNIVKTNQAKNKIRQWFKREQRDEYIEYGKEALEIECRKQSLNIDEFFKSENLQKIKNKFNHKTVDDMFLAIGTGALSAAAVINKYAKHFEKEYKEKMVKKMLATSMPVRDQEKRESLDTGITVSGQPDLLVRVANCCNPLPGDKIKGYTTRGKGVTVHRIDCPNLKHYEKTEPHRLIDVEWSSSGSGKFYTEVYVTAEDRPRLGLEVMGAVSDSRVIITGARINVNKDGIATIEIKMELNNMQQLDHVINKIRRVKDVIEVKRVGDK